MTPDEFIKGQLVLLAYREAHHHGGINNMLAVMFVVRNRVHAGWQGGEWLRVMDTHNAFRGDTLPATEALYLPDLREPVMQSVLAAVDDIYAGEAQDIYTDPKDGGGGALYYADLAHVESDWFRENICRKPEQHPRVASVGSVTFFR